MALLSDPVTRETGTALRSQVAALRARTPRGRTAFPVHICAVAAPATPPATAVAEDPRFTVGVRERLDLAARTEAVGTLLDLAGERSAPPWLLLFRPGRPGAHDADAEWLAAALAAYAEAGKDLTFVVITRTGWFDPRSGAGRTWARLRTT